MGCNMCVVQKPEEQYRVMFQVNTKQLTGLSGDPTLGVRNPVLSGILRHGARHRAALNGAPAGLVTVGTADCVDSCTQTDISFQHMLTLGRGSQHPCGAPAPPHPPPSPPLPPLLEPYLLNELFMDHVYYDPVDYFDVAQHEADRQEELEYEEVELYKSQQQDKLGLTVCYRTDDEEDLGIFVGEVNPNSIAAMDGRIRKGDRILQVCLPPDLVRLVQNQTAVFQINGVDVQDREEAVAILTREDSTNVSLLLARPEIEDQDVEVDPEEPVDSSARLASDLMSGSSTVLGTVACGVSSYSSDLLQTVLSNSQELDSGVGRTDESTRYEESSEHDLLGDDHTSAPNTNATNTPGSMRRFLSSRGGTPPLLRSQDLQFSTDSLLGLDSGDPVRAALPGLTEEECERYKELLEIKCFYEKNRDGPQDEVSLDVNRNENLTQHEMALLEEELRHLEFKCRNILRAQKMQQLRERCLKAWPLEESAGTSPGAGGLWDINELPEKERLDNTGGGGRRSTPLVNQGLEREEAVPPRPRGEEQANLNHSTHFNKRGFEPRSSRSLSQNGGSRRASEGGGVRRKESDGSDQNSPYLSQPPQRYRSCMQLRSTSDRFGGLQEASREDDMDPDGDSSPMSLGSTCRNLELIPKATPTSPRMEWKVKIRSDGSRYVAKRPVRDRLLKARAMKISEERSGMTTDDDAVSEMKMGRYWSKEERKQQLLKAREQRRRKEFMMQSRLGYLRERDTGQQGATQYESNNVLELCHRKSSKKRSRRILDNWFTIQELLTHGSRSSDGSKVYNPLLSVTTV
ncbi:PDZ domain-containing protein 4-like isoform X1 [Synchiropus splendidus]|uniref:PDZ domain-containing protein 4-like isoform X1 n=1 Tax=Synchiropus splendidus TaxID=270530 RepID=UPI00237E30FB|nr:PDZ domain-containing protein 4-like isoform X1 [Synchiropus splendidus]